MMRFVRLLLAGLLLAVALLAAEQHAEHPEGGESHPPVDLWKTVNFAILAAGLGWLIRKFALGYLNGRTVAIQEGIREAHEIKAAAEARAAEMERRLAGLDAEIAQLRARGLEEIAEEEARLRAETGRAMARMQTNAEQEMASAVKQARKELRAQAAELALRLARQKVAERMTPEAESRLMGAFVQDVGRVFRKQV